MIRGTVTDASLPGSGSAGPPAEVSSWLPVAGLARLTPSFQAR